MVFSFLIRFIKSFFELLKIVEADYYSYADQDDIWIENKIELAVSDEVLAERKAKWVPRAPKVTTGYLARYASMVTSGNRGAILEIPR